MTLASRALVFASRWFHPAIVHRTFEPLIADWQHEWQTTERHRRWRVSMRGFAAFVCAAVISSPAVFTTPVPRSMSWHVAKRIVTFCLVAGGALSIPLLRSLGGRELDPPLWAGLLLMAIPTALIMAFPLAMVMAVDAIRTHVNVPHYVERAAALKLAVIAVAVMLSVVSFAAPFAARQWLAVSTPAGWNIPQPRPQQLSTLALLSHEDRHSGFAPPGHYSRAGVIRRELINRSVLSVMPALLIWLRWSALSRPRRNRFWPLPSSLMTIGVGVTYFATLFGGSMLERMWALDPGTGLFLPLAVFGLWSLAEQLLSNSREGAGDLFAPSAKRSES